MRHTQSSSSSDARSSSWTDRKMAAKEHFERGNYEDALSCYRAALTNCPPAERQIILSNVVACRLKLGGPAQARAAVEDAKQCIALNDQWAKSHIRLASAYIALGEHSNDACNALQRALQLDPGNVTARQMLMRELRRDRVAPSTTPSPSAPPEEQDDTFSRPLNDMPRRFPGNQQHRPPQPQQQQEQRTTQEPADYQAMNIDDSLPILDRVKLYYTRAISWYYSQSEDLQTLLKVALAIMLLYVAFGGRFGLGYLFSSGSGATVAGRQNRARNYRASSTPGARRGNYEPGNAYDRFYHGGQTGQQRNMAGNAPTYDSPGTDAYEYHYRPRNSTTHRSSSFSLLDGNLISVLLVLAMSYLCHRVGVNPFHMLMMMNMFTVHRGGFGGFRRMYGMGYGMPRAWWGGGGRAHPGGFAPRRNGWY